MTCRAAAAQHECSPARPIDGEETRRCEIDRRHDGAGRYRSLDFRSGQIRKHTVANVVEIRRARAKIFVVGRFVARDFLLHRLEPRVIGRAARLDRRERRLGEHVIVEQRNLEFQNCSRFLGRALDERPEIDE